MCQNDPPNGYYISFHSTVAYVDKVFDISARKVSDVIMLVGFSHCKFNNGFSPEKQFVTLNALVLLQRQNITKCISYHYPFHRIRMYQKMYTY